MNSYAFFKFLDFLFNLFDMLWNHLSLIPLAHLVDIHFTYPHTSESLKNQIRLYEAWNKPEKAEEWRTKLAQRNDAEKPD